MRTRPFSSAAQQNREVILAVLKEAFKTSSRILEIGSGSGQHAACFSQHLNHLDWQASDRREMLAGINLWLEKTDALPAIELDVCGRWPRQTYDGAFAANVAHIMHWHEIEAMFSGLDRVLTKTALFCLYGPFSINGDYLSASNLEFDAWLRARDPLACIRDKTDLDQLAASNHWQPYRQWRMPANNLILSWQKT